MTPQVVQQLRFLDVFVLGPWLLLVSTQPRLSPSARNLLALVGVGTILVNGYLWWQERQATK
jgi:hypothetical protein